MMYIIGRNKTTSDVYYRQKQNNVGTHDQNNVGTHDVYYRQKQNNVYT